MRTMEFKIWSVLAGGDLGPRKPFVGKAFVGAFGSEEAGREVGEGVPARPRAPHRLASRHRA